jgi:two-component system sensor histidine kinase HydH
MARISPQAARWGLLVTTLAMGAALLGTGVTGYLGARATSLAVTRATAADLVFAVRRDLRTAGSVEADALKETLADLEDRGVRFIAILDGDERPVAAAGVAADPAEFGPPEPLVHAGPRLQLARSGPRVKLTTPLVPGPRGPVRRALQQLAPRWDALRERFAPLKLQLEFDSLTARSIRRRALLTLLVSLAAAGLLALAAVVFWRQSRRGEAAAAQLERDRQLTVLGEMSAVLGHELRNPLASLKGHAQLLVEKLPEGAPGRRGAETIVREALRLERLAAHILEFVRTGALERGPADPAAVAASAAAAVADARVRVVVAGADGGERPPASVPLDAARMEEVLVNLLRNALAASPADGVVELVVGGAGGGLVYEVRDRGEGLEPGDEERVFAPFYTRRAQGTGLGLAVARKIVEGHGGVIRAERRAGGGARFRIVIDPPGAAAP